MLFQPANMDTFFYQQKGMVGLDIIISGGLVLNYNGLRFMNSLSIDGFWFMNGFLFINGLLYILLHEYIDGFY